MSLGKRREMVDRKHRSLSITRHAPCRECPVRSVLTAQRSLGQRPVPHAGHGPAVFGDPLLRVQADESLAGAAHVSTILAKP